MLHLLPPPIGDPSYVITHHLRRVRPYGGFLVVGREQWSQTWKSSRHDGGAGLDCVPDDGVDARVFEVERGLYAVCSACISAYLRTQDHYLIDPP